MDFDNEVMRALGRIEGKLEESLKDAATQRATVTALSERVSRVERWQSYLKGAWAVGAAGFLAILKGLWYGR